LIFAQADQDFLVFESIACTQTQVRILDAAETMCDAFQSSSSFRQDWQRNRGSGKRDREILPHIDNLRQHKPPAPGGH